MFVCMAVSLCVWDGVCVSLCVSKREREGEREREEKAPHPLSSSSILLQR